MTVNYERKTVQAYSGSEVDINYGSLKSALTVIQKLIAQYGEDAEIRTYSPDYSDGEYLGVYIMRPETDGEMARRIAEEKQREAWQAVRDREEFARLKKLFDN